MVGALLVACSSAATPPATSPAPASAATSAAVSQPSSSTATPVLTSAPAVGTAAVASAAVAPAAVLPATISPPTRPSVTVSPAAAPSTGVAFVDVAVATLWHLPSSPRSVDAAALTAPVGVRPWLAAMTTTQRRELNGRVDSQLLLGERVIVDQVRDGWAHVVVPDQPTPLDARGYPGWIPLAQLTFRAVRITAQEAVVVAPIAWVYGIDGVRLFEVSMATRMPVLSVGVGTIDTSLPDGRAAVLHSSDVRVVEAAGAPLPNTSADVVRTAQLFAGLPYLWGGTSGFGFDCSGLTHLVFAIRGVTIARDADAQARGGRAVARADLQPGDLVFFAAHGVVHHVGIYLGNNTMLSSLQTGSPVLVSSLAAQPFASEYAGARRYVAVA